MTLQEITLRTVPVVEPSTSLDEVVYLMENEPLNVVVLVGDEQYMGMFTPDALANLAPPGIELSDLAVGPYVHPVRVIVRPDMASRKMPSNYGAHTKPCCLSGQRRVNYLGVLTLPMSPARRANPKQRRPFPVFPAEPYRASKREAEHCQSHQTRSR